MSEENNREETAVTNNTDNTDVLDSVEASVENEKTNEEANNDFVEEKRVDINEKTDESKEIESTEENVDPEQKKEEGSGSWICSKCGAVLDSDDEFCSKCGTPRVIKCTNCGAVIKEGQDFCPKCGKRVATTKEKIVSAIKESNEKAKKNKKIIPIIAIAAAAVVIVIVLVMVLGRPPVSKITIEEESFDLIENETVSAAYIIEPENAAVKDITWESSDESVATVDANGTITAVGSGACNITVYADKKKDSVKVSVKSEIENYLETGNYEKAYECAETDDEKQNVIAENVAAVESDFAIKNLKDPSSFVLREGYYLNDEGFGRIVLEINGNNSYGASISNYWLFSLNEDTNEWEYFCSVSDLSLEEYSEYDDEDEMYEKLVDNIGKEVIKTVMDKGIKLNKAAIGRINALFQEDTLDAVKLIDEATKIVGVKKDASAA